jgi:hypothetical protein
MAAPPDETRRGWGEIRKSDRPAASSKVLAIPEWSELHSSQTIGPKLTRPGAIEAERQAGHRSSRDIQGYPWPQLYAVVSWSALVLLSY